MSFFSSSTSRLILPRSRLNNNQQDLTSIQSNSLGASAKYASTEGRFTIIDERRKNSSSNDSSSDSSSDEDFDYKTVSSLTNEKGTITTTISKTKLNEATQSVSWLKTPSIGTLKSGAMSASRFKIVPLELRYKRGRWACYDFYDTEAAVKRERRIEPLFLPDRIDNSLSLKSLKNIPVKQMFSTNDLPMTAPKPNDQPSPVSFTFDFQDESDDENRPCKPMTNSSGSKTKSMPQMIPQKKGDSSMEKIESDIQQKLRTDLAGSIEGSRMTPIEMIHNFGLERSLSVTSKDQSILGSIPSSAQASSKETTDPANDDGRRSWVLHPDEPEKKEIVSEIPPSSSLSWPAQQEILDALCSDLLTNAAPTGQNESISARPTDSSPVVAIDNKIEQAMIQDLVKTHLMFAVREEVEVLRAKIVELESTIFQLESENSILREHVPVEALSQLSTKTPSPPNVPTSSALP